MPYIRRPIIKPLYVCTIEHLQWVIKLCTARRNIELYFLIKKDVYCMLFSTKKANYKGEYSAYCFYKKKYMQV